MPLALELLKIFAKNFHQITDNELIKFTEEKIY